MNEQKEKKNGRMSFDTSSRIEQYKAIEYALDKMKKKLDAYIGLYESGPQTFFVRVGECQAAQCLIGLRDHVSRRRLTTRVQETREEVEEKNGSLYCDLDELAKSYFSREDQDFK